MTVLALCWLSLGLLFGLLWAIAGLASEEDGDYGP